jgi:hypothetical protein
MNKWQDRLDLIRNLPVSSAPKTADLAPKKPLSYNIPIMF